MGWYLVILSALAFKWFCVGFPLFCVRVWFCVFWNFDFFGFDGLVFGFLGILALDFGFSRIWYLCWFPVCGCCLVFGFCVCFGFGSWLYSWWFGLIWLACDVCLAVLCLIVSVLAGILVLWFWVLDFGFGFCVLGYLVFGVLYLVFKCLCVTLLWFGFGLVLGLFWFGVCILFPDILVCLVAISIPWFLRFEFGFSCVGGYLVFAFVLCFGLRVWVGYLVFWLVWLACRVWPADFCFVAITMLACVLGSLLVCVALWSCFRLVLWLLVWLLFFYFTILLAGYLVWFCFCVASCSCVLALQVVALL